MAVDTELDTSVVDPGAPSNSITRDRARVASKLHSDADGAPTAVRGYSRTAFSNPMQARVAGAVKGRRVDVVASACLAWAAFSW
jgi:hypothetical protein